MVSNNGLEMIGVWTSRPDLSNSNLNLSSEFQHVEKTYLHIPAHISLMNVSLKNKVKICICQKQLLYPNVAIYEEKSLIYVISCNNKIQTYIYICI